MATVPPSRNPWEQFPPARPVEGGLSSIAARDASGVGTELVQRVLEHAGVGVASRGRAYARRGQTVTLTIERGRIAAAVQGSADVPYEVSIRCDVHDDDRRRFLAALRLALPHPLTRIPATASPALRAQIAGCGLLEDPRLTMECTCPYGGVCKHLVALAYVAGERLDQSPAAVGALLGLTAVGTDADALDDATGGGADDDRAPREVFDRRRHAQLARALAQLDQRDPPDRETVFAGAAQILDPPPTVADVLQ